MVAEYILSLMYIVERALKIYEKYTFLKEFLETQELAEDFLLCFMINHEGVLLLYSMG